MAKTLTAAQRTIVANAAIAGINLDNATQSYDEAIENLSLLDMVSTKPVLAAELAKQYAAKHKVAVTVTEKVSDGRGVPKGTLVYVFNDGKYDDDTVAGNCSKKFRRMCKDAWQPEVAAAADTDAAEALLKALKRVVDGRAKLSAADRRRFAKLSAGLGVSFV